MTRPKQSCGICSEVLGDRYEVTCDGPCGQTFHAICVDLSKTHLNAWTAKVGLQWFCGACRLDFDAGVRRRESVLQATIRKMFGEVQRTIRDLALKVEAMDRHMKQRKQPDSSTMEGDESSEDVDILGQQQFVPGAEKSLMICEDFAERGEKLHTADKELIIASTYDEPDACTDHEESASASILQKPKPQLSSNIWAQVFWHLNFTDLCQIRLVCTEWKKTVDADQSLMEKFSLNFPKSITIDRDFEAVAMLPASAITFEECTIVAVGSWWAPKITENLAQLQLKNCKISLINLLEMLRYAAHLRTLSLGCGSTLTYNSAVDKISDIRLGKMETLEIDYVKQDEILQVLGKVFHRLKDFKLLSRYDNCHRGLLEVMKSTKSLEALSLPYSSRVLSDLAAGVTDRLKRVSVKVPSYNGTELSEELIHFSRSQSLLESFNLNVQGEIRTYIQNHDPDFDIYDFKYIYENTDKYNLNDKALTEVFLNLSKLKHLSMSFVRICNTSRRKGKLWEVSAEISLQSIGSLTELEYLAFNGIASRNSDYQEISFWEAKNPKLTELHLSRVTSPSDCPQRFDLQEYIENAPKLRVITLETCLLNSWSDLFAPIQLKEFRRLKLTSVRMRNENDSCLLEYFDQLRYLELTNCQMSEDFLSTLLRLSPRVEELYLSKMEQAGDAVVLALSQKMKQLLKLTLDQCPITDAAVEHVIEYAENLEQLTITSCSAVTSEAKSQLEATKILMLKIDIKDDVVPVV